MFGRLLLQYWSNLVNYYMHYIIVICIILCIIGFQLYSFGDTIKKLKKYQSIFPKDTSSYSVNELCLIEREANDDEYSYLDLKLKDKGIFVSQIQVKDPSTTLTEITNALNKYLQKNKGSASDFHLMKDVVERYCDSEEEEISTQQPIPLYLGLMGTMVGIIVGIAYVAISGGLVSAKIVDNISELMSCVAIAMFASFIGIYCTTRISWRSKNAFSAVETDKNNFYSWLQTELLPTLSGDTVNALYMLQQNLSTFNATFQTNITGLNRALEQVKDTSTEQVELISLIKGIDIKRVAEANITVLRELKDCTGELSTFNRYLHEVSNYLTAVNDLNGNINEHLNRTAAIERMGTFFEQEINQVKNREQYINEVVANVDNRLKQTFENLSESTVKGMTNLKNDSATQFDSVSQVIHAQEQDFKETLRAQRDEFAQSLKKEQEAFLDYLQNQKESLSSKSDEISEIIKEIRSLADAKSGLLELIAVSKQQNACINELVQTLKDEYDNIDSGRSMHVPTYLKISIVAMCFATIASTGLGVTALLKNNSDDNQPSIELIDNERENLTKSIDSLQNILDEVTKKNVLEDNM